MGFNVRKIKKSQHWCCVYKKNLSPVKKLNKNNEYTLASLSLLFCFVDVIKIQAKKKEEFVLANSNTRPHRYVASKQMLQLLPTKPAFGYVLSIGSRTIVEHKIRTSHECLSMACVFFFFFFGSLFVVFLFSFTENWSLFLVFLLWSFLAWSWEAPKIYGARKYYTAETCGWDGYEHNSNKQKQANTEAK